jgi:hypothetical protein
MSCASSSEASGVPTVLFSRYSAPLVEEALKALWIVVLLRRRRIRFLVDAAILGFAVGAGFTLVENVEYLRELAEPRPLLWLVRGFGAAVLHGATTSVFALLTKELSDRHPGSPWLTPLPGLLAAAARDLHLAGRAAAAGLEPPVGEDVRANLAELRYLERSIRTALDHGAVAFGPGSFARSPARGRLGRSLRRPRPSRPVPHGVCGSGFRILVRLYAAS